MLEIKYLEEGISNAFSAQPFSRSKSGDKNPLGFTRNNNDLQPDLHLPPTLSVRLVIF